MGFLLAQRYTNLAWAWGKRDNPKGSELTQIEGNLKVLLQLHPCILLSSAVDYYISMHTCLPTVNGILF